MASAGVAVTYGAVRVLGSASSVLMLVGAAMFFALGLEPAVSALVNRESSAVGGGQPGGGRGGRCRRRRYGGRDSPAGAGSTPVHRTGAALSAGGPEPLVGDRQNQRPIPCATTDHRPDSRLGLIGGRQDVVKAGETVFGAVSHLGIVAVITVYFLADMRRIRATLTVSSRTRAGRERSSSVTR